MAWHLHKGVIRQKINQHFGQHVSNFFLVTAKPAAGEPIPVAPVEHVQLFPVKYSRQKE